MAKDNHLPDPIPPDPPSLHLRFSNNDNDLGVYGRELARGEVVGLAFDGRGWLELAVAYIGVHRAGATCLLMNHTAVISLPGASHDK